MKRRSLSSETTAAQAAGKGKHANGKKQRANVETDDAVWPPPSEAAEKPKLLPYAAHKQLFHEMMEAPENKKEFQKLLSPEEYEDIKRFLMQDHEQYEYWLQNGRHEDDGDAGKDAEDSKKAAKSSGGGVNQKIDEKMTGDDPRGCIQAEVDDPLDNGKSPVYRRKRKLIWQQYRWCNRYALAGEKGKEELVVKGGDTDVPDVVQPHARVFAKREKGWRLIATPADVFDVIRKFHHDGEGQAVHHGQKLTYSSVSENYANITLNMVKRFVNLCDCCPKCNASMAAKGAALVVEEDMAVFQWDGKLPDTYVEGFHDVESVKKMVYRKLGSTGYTVSVLGMGASALGGVFHSVSEKECVQVVRETLKAGVNVIDTAPWYGQGKSEEMLGKALVGVPRKAYMLNTKVGRYNPDICDMFDFTAARVTESVDVSLKRLGVEYIDAIQVHDMEFAPSLDIIVNQTLPALQRLKEAGKVKLIGITGYPLEQFQYVLSKSKVKVDTVLSYCRSTLLDSSINSVLPVLEEAGVGIFNAAPTGMGLLTENGPPEWHPASDTIKTVCTEARRVCASRNVNIARLAVRSSLVNERLATTFLSFAKMEFVKVNLSSVFDEFSPSEKETLQILRKDVFGSHGDLHWEGVEVDRYFQDLGRKLQSERLYKDG